MLNGSDYLLTVNKSVNTVVVNFEYSPGEIGLVITVTNQNLHSIKGINYDYNQYHYYNQYRYR